MENWFPVDEVAKNCQKRREVDAIIRARMEYHKWVLPKDFTMPVLNFTDPVVKTPHNPHNYQTQQRIPNLNPSSPTNPASNFSKPSTSQNFKRTNAQIQNHVTRNNSGYHNRPYYSDYNEETDDESIESIDDEVERQYNPNDRYDSNDEYNEDNEEYTGLQNQGEYYPENVENIEQVEDEEGSK